MSGLASQITNKIKTLPLAITFGYKDLDIDQSQYVNAAKVLERLQGNGLIKKVAKGKFYRPQPTVFGELMPNTEDLLKPYLFKEGKRIAYITGTALYNEMGLTRQVPVKIKIASREKRIFIQSGRLKVTPIKSYAEISDDNYRLLGFLDALKDINIIPDLDDESAIKVLTAILKKKTKKELELIVIYSLKYPPRVRALLGALLQTIGMKDFLKKLKNSLNPFSTYKTVVSKLLVESANWNLI